ncbi:acyltransferase family protein [Myceligenerans indicum]|uniref:Acyltransferase family protein n=1 Tax=Myceligenerans indicum TaxID=2593663 RepID=A0ABS1LIC1_9MICO|nr:acyltransferase family protein [Myceligenerans indicum]MBL0885573.1 acyltransferase family protein [Myceligenerans indicum]
MFTAAPHSASRSDTARAARSRLAWADAARGLAICLVVLYHSTNWTAATGYDVSFLREFDEPLRSLRMPLFFMVAGMFATKWVAASWSTLLRGKIFWFAWVFVLWEPVSLVIRLSTGYYEVAGADWSTLAGDLAWSLLIPRSELWFIWTLAAFFVLARLLRPVPVRVQLLAAAVVSAWALAGWEPESIAYRGTAQFALFFLAGLHLRPLVEAYADRLRWWSGLLTVCAWYGVTWMVQAAGLESVPGPYLVANLAGALAGIAISVALARYVPGLGWVGTRTLPMYVTHTPLIHTILWVYWSNGIWIPAPQSQWIPVFMSMTVAAAALTLDALTQRIGLGWVWGPPRRWLSAP